MSLLETARASSAAGYTRTPRVLVATEADLTECYQCGREALAGLVEYAGMDFCGNTCLDSWSEQRAELATVLMAFFGCLREHEEGDQ